MRSAFGEKVSAQLRKAVETSMQTMHGMLNAGTAEMAEAVVTIVESTAYDLVAALPDASCRMLAEGPLLYWYAQDVAIDTNVPQDEARKKACPAVFGVAETELATSTTFKCNAVLRRLLTRELNAYSGLDPAFLGACITFA